MNDIENRTLTLKRTFNAPVKLVWEAWTQPKHIAAWWARGMDLKIIEHDFQIGGRWKYSMEMPNGGEFISEGVFSLIEEFEKIFSSADFRPMTEGVEIQAYFEKNEDSTNFTFKVIHPTQEYCEQQKNMGFMSGWGGVFDALENHVSSLSVSENSKI